jgi:hypothetical protein
LERSKVDPLTKVDAQKLEQEYLNVATKKKKSKRLRKETAFKKRYHGFSYCEVHGSGNGHS